jgi:hypothetical protein
LVKVLCCPVFFSKVTLKYWFEDVLLPTLTKISPSWLFIYLPLIGAGAPPGPAPGLAPFYSSQ